MLKPTSFLGVLFIFLVLNVSNAQDRATAKEARADSYFQQGYYSKAADLYRKVLNKIPETERIRIKLARAYFQTSQLEQSAKLYSQLIHKQYLVRSIDYLYYAQALESMGLEDQAIKWGSKYLEINPKSIAAQNLVYGLTYQQTAHRPDLPQTASSSPWVAATLLKVTNSGGTNLYVLTDQRLIEVKGPVGHKNLWLHHLMEENRIRIEQSIQINPVLFSVNSNTIESVYQMELDRIVKLMHEHEFIGFELAAFADDLQTEQYNMLLSQKRAESVLDYLVSRKVAADRLICLGQGETKILPEPMQYQTHDNTRRTEFRLIRVNKNQVVGNY